MFPLSTALERLYHSHSRELRAFTRCRVGTQEAEDIVQEIYLRALQDGGVASARHPRAYLFRIAANLIVDATRKAQVRARYAERGVIELPGGEAQETAAAIENIVELRQLCAHLDELPSPCRKAFLLCWLSDLDASEAAKRLGVTVRTVERHISRAREHLQRRGAP